MSIAPVITTQRLVLRPHVIEDFEYYASLFASDRAVHMGQLKRRHAWYCFTSDVAQWCLMGMGAWAVEDRKTSAFVGQVAVMQPDHFPEVELGWFVVDQAEGKGVAFEAASAALNHAKTQMSLPSLVSYIAADNNRSIALAERLGATVDKTAAVDDPDDLVYRHALAG